MIPWRAVAEILRGVLMPGARQAGPVVEAGVTLAVDVIDLTGRAVLEAWAPVRLAQEIESASADAIERLRVGPP